MQQPPALADARRLAPGIAPRFAVIERKPPRPAAIMLAMLTAAGVLVLAAVGLGHSRARRFANGGASASRTPGGAPGPHSAADKDEPDDPSQIDTIVLGDAADAPVPKRRSDHISDVHATIIIRLPRYGDDIGLIPDTPSGHLLFSWLAAFNQGSSAALERALPNIALDDTVAAQMILRLQTGGFRLVSAREVQPGLMVFRLRDQTPLGTEVLGTLHMRANSNPAAIASLSLRAVADTTSNAASAAAVSRASH